MMRLFICPECGWMRTVSRTGFCGMFQVQRCDDAAGETGIYPVCEDVGTGTNGLCRQLDVYPSEKEQIEYKSPCREICVGIFLC